MRFICMGCGRTDHADINAAINIRRRWNTPLLDVEGGVGLPMKRQLDETSQSPKIPVLQGGEDVKLSVNARNIGGLVRRELPHALIIGPRKGMTTFEWVSNAATWCEDNFGRCATGLLPKTHRDYRKSFLAFYYHGRWAHIGITFYFRSPTEAAAFKLVWG